MNLESLLTPEKIQQALEAGLNGLLTHVLVVDNLIQLALLLLAVLIGRMAGRRIRRFLSDRWEDLAVRQVHVARFVQAFFHQLPLVTALALLGAGSSALAGVIANTFVLSVALNLMAAWILVQLATSVILDRFWSRLVAAAAWTLAALNILGILRPTLDLLRNLGFRIGQVELNALSVLKALVLLAILLRAAGWVSAFLERKLGDVPELSPSSRVLVSKVVKISIFALVCVVALNSVGIDLTALAVLSGAVGVGIGFGLQKVIGNLVSGIILLMDNSIKPGDVIQIGDVYGWITELRARYVSVNTRDGKEYLIPNEDLITQQVVNWSFSNKNIRIKVPVGISYHDDPHRAIDLILESVRRIPRVLEDPEPKCLLVGFGDSSVDLQVRFWLDDPQNGVANVTSQVLLAVWDTLKENGIEIPFPQRDVHLDVTGPVGVRNQGGAEPGP